MEIHPAAFTGFPFTGQVFICAVVGLGSAWRVHGRNRCEDTTVPSLYVIVSKLCGNQSEAAFFMLMEKQEAMGHCRKYWFTLQNSNPVRVLVVGRVSNT